MPKGYYVRNNKPVFDRLMKRVVKTDSCWLWTGVVNHGYGKIWTGPSDGKWMSTHRIAWEHHFGPIPDNLWVLHKCDVKLCVNPDHLFLGTHQDNMNDLKNKCLTSSGERHYNSKLTEEQVKDILSNNLSQGQNAKLYGISAGVIRNIRKRKAWVHVKIE